MEQLNSDTLHMKKDKFSELLHYVFDKPHNHLMIKYSTLELYKEFQHTNFEIKNILLY